MENQIGNIIKRYRKMRDLSQTQLAELVCYKDKTSISKIEKGIATITVEQAKAIAKALRFSPILLLCESYEDVEEFLPYLAQANENTLDNIRAILGMPRKKKICDSGKKTG